MSETKEYPSRVAISREASNALKQIARLTNQKRQGYVSNLIIEAAKIEKAKAGK